MTTQIVQGLNLPKIAGTVLNINVDIAARRQNLLISPNETEIVKVGAFTKRDYAVTDNVVIELASATTPKEQVLFVERISAVDDIQGTSQGDVVDPNGLIQKSRNVVYLANSPFVFYAVAGDSISAGELVMIDDTDDERATLIPYEEATSPAPTNYAIAIAEETATQAGQVIAFKAI